MRQLILTMMPAWAALAQTVIGPADIPAAQKRLDNGRQEKILRCDVNISRPELNFGLRWQAGYVLHVPLVQYTGAVRHVWRVSLKVTPDGDQPTYLADRFDLPAMVNPDFAVERTGTFLLGEGGYDVDFAAADEQDRVCRKQWRLEAAIGRADRAVKVAIPPHTVADLSWMAPVVEPPPTPSPRRLTILMNGAKPYSGPPVRPFGNMIVPHTAGPQIESMMDYRDAILGILASLIEKLAGTSIRLVVFDLDQQKETLRQEDFTLRDMEKAAHAANNTDHWPVTVGELQEQRGPWALLERVVRSEIDAPQPSGAVLILGPRIGPLGRMPAHLFDQEKSAHPPFFYMQYRLAAEPIDYGAPASMGRKSAENTVPRGISGPDASLTPEVSDPIELLVARWKGKVLRVHSPTEFAKAVETIRRESSH